MTGQIDKWMDGCRVLFRKMGKGGGQNNVLRKFRGAKGHPYLQKNMQSIIPQQAAGNTIRNGKRIFPGWNMMRTAKVPSARSAGCLGSHFSKQREYGLPNHLPIQRKL